MTSDEEQWADLGEDVVEVFAAIMEATCADCLDAHPHHLCCDDFYCRTHYLAHARLYHPSRLEAA